MTLSNVLLLFSLISFLVSVFIGLSLLPIKKNNKTKTQETEQEIQLLRDEAKNYIKHHRDLQIRLSKIDKYLEENYNLSFQKIESLLKQENYRKNNVIDIRNYLKSKK